MPRRKKSSLPRLFDGPEYRIYKRKKREKATFERSDIINFRIEAKLKEKLRQRAREEGVSLSELTRRIVEAWLRGDCYEGSNWRGRGKD